MLRIFYSDEGGELRVDLDGHGDLRNFENLDVMCAAVTTLTNTLSFSVIRAENAGMLDENPTVYVGEDGEGKGRILCVPKPEYYSIVRTMFETVIGGYQILATYYPDHVEFSRG
jgi:uncharacterized protein YsxB (DUF464 family)